MQRSDVICEQLFLLRIRLLFDAQRDLLAIATFLNSLTYLYTQFFTRATLRHNWRKKYAVAIVWHNLDLLENIACQRPMSQTGLSNSVRHSTKLQSAATWQIE